MSALARLKAALAEEQGQEAPTPHTGKTCKSPFEPFACSGGGRVFDAEPAPMKMPNCILNPAASANAFDMPPEWALPIANLSNSPSPGDYEPAAWRDALAGMEAFCAQWAGRARALGWEGEELFSLHPTAPAARHDKRGLALSLGSGARVESLDSEGADIRTIGGSRLRFYRKAGQ